MNEMKNWQQILLTGAFLFNIGCLAGWVLEVFYRRFLSKNNPERRWINPGFLTGPYLPLYGFGLVSVFAMSFLPYIGLDPTAEITPTRIAVCILCMGVLMTVIEYIAGIVFIRGMKIKLWDYSDRWGNIQGIICPTFSLIWTVMSAGYYFFIQPQMIKLVSWYYNNVAFTFIVGMFFGVFLVDLWYSLRVGAKVRKFAVENGIVVKYEELKVTVQKNKQNLQERGRFMLALASTTPLAVHLRSYADGIKDNQVMEKMIAAKDKIVSEIKEEIDELEAKREARNIAKIEAEAKKESRAESEITDKHKDEK